MSIKLITNKAWHESVDLHVGDAGSTLYTASDAKNVTTGPRHLRAKTDTADRRITYVNKAGGLNADTVFLGNAKNFLGHRLSVHGWSNYLDKQDGQSLITSDNPCAEFAKANNEFLSLANASAGDFKFGDIDFCFFGWFYFSATGSGTSLFDMWNGSGNNRAFEISSAGSNMAFYICADGTTATYSSVSTAFSTGWHFFYAYHDATANEIGISFDNAAATTASHTFGGAYDSSTDNFKIASSNGSTGGLDGRAQFVGCAHSVLTSDQLSTLYNSGNGIACHELSATFKSDISLVSYWNMTDPTNFGHDSHGSNHLTDNGTIQIGESLNDGTRTLDPDDFGRYPCAKFAKANNEFFSLSNADADDFKFGDNDFTFFGWWDGLTSGDSLIDFWNPSGDNRVYELVAGGANINFNITADGTAPSIDSVGAAYTGGWDFVCIYNDSVNNLIGISINGAAFTTSAHSGGAYTTTSPGWYTCGDGGSGDLDGRAQFFGACSKVLTRAEVAYLYNSGSGRAYSELSDTFKTQGNLVSYYDYTDSSNLGKDSHGTNDFTDNGTVQIGVGLTASMEALSIIDSNFVAGGVDDSDCVYEFTDYLDQEAIGVLCGNGDGAAFTEDLSKFYIGADFLEIQDIGWPVVENPVRQNSAKKIGSEYYRVEKSLQITLNNLTRTEANGIEDLIGLDEPIVLFDKTGDHLRDNIYHCVVESYDITAKYNDLYTLSMTALRLKHV